eukprot:3903813-Pleurochrysis_carterae.AAC.3
MSKTCSAAYAVQIRQTLWASFVCGTFSMYAPRFNLVSAPFMSSQQISFAAESMRTPTRSTYASCASPRCAKCSASSSAMPNSELASSQSAARAATAAAGDLDMAASAFVIDITNARKPVVLAIIFAHNCVAGRVGDDTNPAAEVPEYTVHLFVSTAHRSGLETSRSVVPDVTTERRATPPLHPPSIRAKSTKSMPIHLTPVCRKLLIALLIP